MYDGALTHFRINISNYLITTFGFSSIIEIVRRNRNMIRASIITFVRKSMTGRIQRCIKTRGEHSEQLVYAVK